jgi:hypothetical protein
VQGLVRRAIDDPQTALPAGFALWSRLKAALFPRGPALWLALAAYVTIFLFMQRGSGLRRELAMLGLMTTLAAPVEMYIAIIGDGPLDLLKHLFFANILFDVATIALLGLAVIGSAQAMKTRVTALTRG